MVLVIPQSIEVGFHLGIKRLILFYRYPQIILQVVVIQIACRKIGGTAKYDGTSSLFGNEEQLWMILLFGRIVPANRDLSVCTLVQVHGNWTVRNADFITYRRRSDWGPVSILP